MLDVSAVTILAACASLCTAQGMVFMKYKVPALCAMQRCSPSAAKSFYIRLRDARMLFGTSKEESPLEAPQRVSGVWNPT